MANPERGEAGVTVDGKVYTLRPTFDALCELEELVGKPLHELLAGIQEGRLSGLRAVIWCFLQDEHADDIRVLKDASRWIERAGGTDVVMGHVQTVLGLNAPEETVRRRDPVVPRKARAGTGRRSSSVRTATA